VPFSITVTQPLLRAAGAHRAGCHRVSVLPLHDRYCELQVLIAPAATGRNYLYSGICNGLLTDVYPVRAAGAHQAGCHRDHRYLYSGTCNGFLTDMYRWGDGCGRIGPMQRVSMSPVLLIISAVPPQKRRTTGEFVACEGTAIYRPI